jgi:hypothetical protein
MAQRGRWMKLVAPERSTNRCSDVGDRLYRRIFQTMPSSFDFRVGSSFAPRPCLSGGSRILCDVKPNNGTGHATKSTGLCLRNDSQTNRGDTHPTCPHGRFPLFPNLTVSPAGSSVDRNRKSVNPMAQAPVRNDLQFRDFLKRATSPRWHVPKTASACPRAGAVPLDATGRLNERGRHLRPLIL